VVGKTEYRSSKRSKAMIKKAFAKLLHEKDISKITVTDIVQEAEISRGTFYAHYKDVANLFEQIEAEELRQLLSLVDEIGYRTILTSPKIFLNEMLKYIGKDMEYYRMLFLANNTSHFVSVIKRALEEKILGEGGPLPKTASKDEISVFITFFSGGLSYTITSWLNGELNAGADELSDILSKIMKRSFEV